MPNYKTGNTTGWRVSAPQPPRKALGDSSGEQLTRRGARVWKMLVPELQLRSEVIPMVLSDGFTHIRVTPTGWQPRRGRWQPTPLLRSLARQPPRRWWCKAGLPHVRTAVTEPWKKAKTTESDLTGSPKTWFSSECKSGGRGGARHHPQGLWKSTWAGGGWQGQGSELFSIFQKSLERNHI